MRVKDEGGGINLQEWRPTGVGGGFNLQVCRHLQINLIPLNIYLSTEKSKKPRQAFISQI